MRLLLQHNKAKENFPASWEKGRNWHKEIYKINPIWIVILL